MRVLVTGGAGFIGSHIVQLLLEEGAEVRVLDSLDPAVHATRPAIDAGAELVVGSVADAAVVARALAEVDAVCHQAAKVGLGVHFGDVVSYAATNDVGTAVLLQALWQRSFTGRLVLASSMVVYGEGRGRCPDHGVVRPAPRRVGDLNTGHFEPTCPAPCCGRRVAWVAVDEACPPDPRNTYAATKLHQEHLCGLWGRDAGATVVALRYHNVYGARMPRNTPYAGVASIFRSALVSGGPPLVFEDGGQTRDFVHVRDVARANLLALTAPHVQPGAYNVASGTPHTVLDLAAALADGFGAGREHRPRVTGEWRAGDVRHIVASPQRAADILGFRAAIGFEEGMAELAAAASLPSGQPPAEQAVPPLGVA